MFTKKFVEDVIENTFKGRNIPGTTILVCTSEKGPLNYQKCYITSLYWNYKSQNYNLFRERICSTADNADSVYREEFQHLIVNMINSSEIWNLIDTKLLSNNSNTNT